MQVNSLFFLNSILFGIGLAVDAFLVALANGLHFPRMSRAKVLGVAATFSTFQFGAPMLGWAIAHAAFVRFSWIEICFAWAAVAVLAALGIKMLIDARNKNAEDHCIKAGVGALIAQCAATSVDALTVGFTIEEYAVYAALACSAIIAATTFVVYLVGFFVGKKFGMRFEKVASVVGGAVFIAIAVEIIITTYI
ncbi:manganese efflux pump MntP family protein [Anaerocaecibacter muris]|uniref:manganese efflux pump MntP n=1 Tax=Anaerocaecibacter muris TaxID=2941513 RepID=UPI00203A9804|nr:manganese efflux pump [Anaerocaecibacter muris]